MITQELKRVILTALKLDDWDIKDETIATQIPGWDSLNHVNVILAVENHFRVRFKPTAGEVRKVVTGTASVVTGEKIL